MKLHLPICLRRAVIALALSSACLQLPVMAESSQVSTTATSGYFIRENKSMSSTQSITASNELLKVEKKAIGGAVFNDVLGEYVLSEYSSIKLNNNYTYALASIYSRADWDLLARAESYGGAVATTGNISLKNNLDISVTNNRATASAGISGDSFFNDYSYYECSSLYIYVRGGALYSESGSVNISDNQYVDFSGNYASYDMTSASRYWPDTRGYACQGGAIYAAAGVVIEGNTYVTFSENDASQGLAIYSESKGVQLIDNQYISFSNHTSTSDGGIIQCAGPVSITGNNGVYFTDNKGAESNTDIDLINAWGINIANNEVFKASGNSGAISGSVITLNDNSLIWVTDNEGHWNSLIEGYEVSVTNNVSLLCTGNFTRRNGAVINSSNDVSFIGNIGMEFSDNEANYGGAVAGFCHFIDNDNVKFLGNTAKYGGAIYCNGVSEFKNNDELLFSQNSASYNGGAIYLSKDCTFDYNNELVFDKNVASSQGGALYTQIESISFNSNRKVYFTDNEATWRGSAVYCDELNFTDNDEILFENNKAGYNSEENTSFRGGSVICSDLNIIGCSDVKFVGNSIKNSNGKELWGGAVYANGSLCICDNDSVVFRGNFLSASETAVLRGGALYYDATYLSLQNNKSVIFEGNYVKYGDDIHMAGAYIDTNNYFYSDISAPEGGKVEFRDSVYIKDNCFFNKPYTDSSGNTIRQSGDIIISGAYVADELRKLKGYVDADELLASQQSCFDAAVFDGRLIIRDGAVVGKGDGRYIKNGVCSVFVEPMELPDGSNTNPTLMMRDGSLDGWCGVYGGSNMETEGCNFVKTLNIFTSTIKPINFTFTVTSRNTHSPVLSCNNFNLDNWYGEFIVNILLNDKTAKKGVYKLIECEYADVDQWTSDGVIVKGLDGFRVSFSDLYWEDNTLYLRYSGIPGDGTTTSVHLTWTNESGDGKWNNTSANWERDGLDYLYEDGAGVIFGAEGVGNVNLQGTYSPCYVLVDSESQANYVFNGSGCLSGSMSLKKTGNGSLTINTANNYTGGTYIEGGALIMGNAQALGKGPVIITKGRLDTNGYNFTGDLTIENGFFSGDYSVKQKRKLTLGNGDGMYIVGDLSLAGGELVTNGFTLNVLGDFSIDNNTIVRLSGDFEGGEEFTLVSATSHSGDLSLIDVVFEQARVTESMRWVGDSLILTIQYIPGYLTWAGEKNAAWYNYCGGWKPQGELFCEGDCVTFYDGVVSILGEVSPGAVTLKPDKSFTFKNKYDKKAGEWSGSIGGEDITVTIVGGSKGKVTINDGNTYTGITSIESGTVSAGGAKSFGESAVTIYGGTLDLKSKEVANDISLTGSATIKGGKKYLGTYTQTGGELMKGSVLNVAEEATISGGTVNGTLSGVGTVIIDGDVELGLTGKITTDKLHVNGSLSASTKGLVMNSKTSAIDINGGMLESQGKVSAASLNLNGGCLSLSGAMSVKDLTLGSGTLTLDGAKLTTVKVGNSLMLEGDTTLNLGFSVKEKDEGKSFKVFTFKTIDSSITDTELNELLGLGTDAATLAFDSKRKSITLTVTDAGAWNTYAESVRTGKLEAVASMDEVLTATDGAYVLTRPAAAVDPLMGKVADTLVQSTWSTAGASRAFGDTIAARGTHATELADGKGAAWISTMGGSSRISTDGAHAGADYTLTGAAFGMEARLSEKSTVGLAIGNSWGKVSTFSAFPVDQDSTHQGIYGKHQLGSSTTLSWMAAHTRTESDANLAGMACDWTQDALQLDARVDKLFAISDRTTVSAFVGMQYLATDKGECNGLSTGSLQNLRGEIGVSAAHKATDRTYIYGELSFIGDMVRHNPTSTVGDYRSRGANPGRAGLNLSVGAGYQLNDSWSLNGSYSLELMQNQTSHSANVGATYSF